MRCGGDGANAFHDLWRSGQFFLGWIWDCTILKKMMSFGFAVEGVKECLVWLVSRLDTLA